MNLVKKNIIEFIDALIVDDYSKAHKFLENVVNEKIKSLIAEAKKENPFAKKDDKKKDKKKKKPNPFAKGNDKVKSKMEDPSDAFKKMQSKFEKKGKKKSEAPKKGKKKK